MFELCPKNLETARLVIRLTTKQDLPEIHSMHRIEAVNQYLPYTTWKSYQDAQDWYQRVESRRNKKEAEQYSVSLQNDSRLIGSCIVFGFDASQASVEVGYVLHPDFWGQGYMLEAMQAFIGALQERLNLRQLKASVEEPNVASSKLLKKLGFSHSNTSVEESGVVLHHWAKILA